MPLATEEQRKHVQAYKLTFRTVQDAKFLTSYGLLKGFGARRAMVFNRPALLSKVFTLLDETVPKEFKSSLQRSSAIYQENTGGRAMGGGRSTTRNRKASAARQTRKLGKPGKGPAEAFQNVWKLHGALKRREAGSS